MLYKSENDTESMLQNSEEAWYICSLKEIRSLAQNQKFNYKVFSDATFSVIDNEWCLCFTVNCVYVFLHLFSTLDPLGLYRKIF